MSGYRSRLAEIMAMRGLNVAALAAKLNPPRFSTQIYRYVSGERTPSTSILQELAAALNCSTDDLLAPIGSQIYGRPDRKEPAAM